METSLFAAAGDAFLILMDPFRLAMLAGGTFLGLLLGLVPGIGGLAGMALILPFTFTMDTYAAFALLLGMASVNNTSDTIPAVLFGVPGSTSAQATVMDGHPMAKNGEAGRALSAAYMASLLGGLFGAIVLAISVPVLRPIIVYVGAPEFLAFALFGLAMVAILSGNAPLRGLVAAALGILLSMVGADSQSGVLRWTGGTVYLWDGLPIVPVVLGLFALPELADLAIKRTQVARAGNIDTRKGMMMGLRDTLRNWWLVVRCSSIGAAIGALPGVSPSVVDWLAYGHAMQTTKAPNKFGRGDVRGVIAPEAANNSTTAGSLVPTIALGIPGSATMAILLTVFLVHGLVPGPRMLTENMTLTYSMVWSIAIANVVGAGVCFFFSGHLARVALLRYSLIVPLVLTFVMIGTFQSSRNWGDFYALILFTIVGWTMKQLRWPRPPMILGLVLGQVVEVNLFISFTRYGWDWLARPVVIVILLLGLLMVLRPIRAHWRLIGGVRGFGGNLGAPTFLPRDLFTVAMIALLACAAAEAVGWRFSARIAPLSICLFAIAVATISLLNEAFSRTVLANRLRDAGPKDPSVRSAYELHMDTESDFEELSRGRVLARALTFIGYIVGFVISIRLIGYIPSVPLFFIVFMLVEGEKNRTAVLIQAAVATALMIFLFDQTMHIPWPRSLLGELVPALRVIPSV